MEVKKAKRQSWKEFGEQIEENYQHDSKKFWKTMKYLRGKMGRIVYSIRDKENKLKTETKEVLEVWKSYYAEKYKNERNDEEIEIQRNNENQEELEMDMDINYWDVQIAVDQMKNGNSAGEDGIRSEMIKAGGAYLTEQLK
ncbi:hypothetical protein ANN_14167 [Periplaneta americana]|uniref:Uncharacterized protein n=1 Tax=Periplaneta americana TaxID=6978 RepID=A0ABQ8SWS4_PERAM|nr:hypothetical protein ANN_14167 [Periplaneta americana]